ncbi:ribbon-helix-helix protein, CopG family [Rhizobium binxianense]
MASLMSFRIDEDLKDQFAEAAQTRHLTQSEAIREALTQYVRRVRNEQMRDAAIRIRRHGEEEADIMRWLSSVSEPIDED